MQLSRRVRSFVLLGSIPLLAQEVVSPEAKSQWAVRDLSAEMKGEVRGMDVEFRPGRLKAEGGLKILQLAGIFSFASDHQASVRTDHVFLCGARVIEAPDVKEAWPLAAFAVSDNRIDYPTFVVRGLQGGATQFSMPAGGPVFTFGRTREEDPWVITVKKMPIRLRLMFVVPERPETALRLFFADTVLPVPLTASGKPGHR